MRTGGAEPWPRDAIVETCVEHLQSAQLDINLLNRFINLFFFAEL